MADDAKFLPAPSHADTGHPLSALHSAVYGAEPHRETTEPRETTRHPSPSVENTPAASLGFHPYPGRDRAVSSSFQQAEPFGSSHLASDSRQPGATPQTISDIQVAFHSMIDASARTFRILAQKMGEALNEKNARIAALEQQNRQLQVALGKRARQDGEELSAGRKKARVEAEAVAEAE